MSGTPIAYADLFDDDEWREVTADHHEDSPLGRLERAVAFAAWKQTCGMSPRGLPGDLIDAAGIDRGALLDQLVVHLTRRVYLKIASPEYREADDHADEVWGRVEESLDFRRDVLDDIARITGGTKKHDGGDGAASRATA